jgi:hypothetical protein
MHQAMQNNPADGWFNHADELLAIVEQLRPMRLLEVGSYKGQSAIALARVLAQWGGQVTCVDTWANTPIGPGDTYPEFCANVRASGLTNIAAIRGDSVEVAGEDWTPFDAIYVDADHTRESVAADLAAWWPHLQVGGLLAGDDYHNPQYPGVAEAWDAFGVEVQPIIAPTGQGLVWCVKGEGPADTLAAQRASEDRHTGTTCTVCNRFLWVSDGDARGRCCFCRTREPLRGI